MSENIISALTYKASMSGRWLYEWKYHLRINIKSFHVWKVAIWVKISSPHYSSKKLDWTYIILHGLNMMELWKAEAVFWNNWQSNRYSVWAHCDTIINRDICMLCYEIAIAFYLHEFIMITLIKSLRLFCHFCLVETVLLIWMNIHFELLKS